MTSATDFFRCIAMCCLGLAAALFVGCGDGRPTRVPVSGQVLLNGKPLHQGYVRFIHDSARASWGQIDESGRFTLTCFDGQDGAVPGLHHVEITSNENINESSMRWFAPKKYADYKTSGVEVEISAATDSVVIELQGDNVPFVEVFGQR